jgi:uncharacterized protein
VRRGALIDTGPLVAFLDAADAHHAWVKTAMAQVSPPLATCEAVVTEACHLLRRARRNPALVLRMMEDELLRVDFDLAEEAEAVARLMERYGNVPMSLADACLVRMSELSSRSFVVTLDSDFAVYRRHGRQVVPLLAPFA